MSEEYVVGFDAEDPSRLTPIDVVEDVTGLTLSEIRDCCKIESVPDTSLTQVGVDSGNEESCVAEEYTCPECSEALNEELYCSCCMRQFILTNNRLYMVETDRIHDS